MYATGLDQGLIPRLRADAAQGDEPATLRLLREAIRRRLPDQVAWCASLDHVDEGLRRRCARRLVDWAHGAVRLLDGAGEPLPFGPYLLRRRYLLSLRRSEMITPVRVALVWSHARLKLFACDCAERLIEERALPVASEALALGYVMSARRQVRGGQEGEGQQDAARRAAAGEGARHHQLLRTPLGSILRLLTRAPDEAIRQLGALAPEHHQRHRAWYCDRILQYLLDEVPDLGAAALKRRRSCRRALPRPPWTRTARATPRP